MFYRSSYSPAEPAEIVQGNINAVQRRMKQTGKVPVAGGPGSVIIAGVSSGRIYEYEDETSTTPIRSIVPNKEMMRMRYHKQRITARDYDKVVDDLNAGKLNFDNLDKGPRF